MPRLTWEKVGIGWNWRSDPPRWRITRARIDPGGHRYFLMTNPWFGSPEVVRGFQTLQEAKAEAERIEKNAR